MADQDNEDSHDTKVDPLSGSEEIGNSPSESDFGPILVNRQTLSKKMEVHHHPDLHHKKKRFREYFLEFLMIFLAVTLGFLAENLREHISDEKRAKSFARSLRQDFKADTLTLHQLIFYTVSKITYIDSVEYYLHVARNRQNDSALYGCVLYLISTFQFDNIIGTYEQIRNSGSLRFFDQRLVDSLNMFDATSNKLKLMEDWENKFLFEKVIPFSMDMFNFKVFDDMRKEKGIKHDMYINNLNSVSIQSLINQGEVIKRLRERQLNQQKALMTKADAILEALSKE